MKFLKNERNHSSDPAHFKRLTDEIKDHAKAHEAWRQDLVRICKKAGEARVRDELAAVRAQIATLLILLGVLMSSGSFAVYRFFR